MAPALPALLTFVLQNPDAPAFAHLCETAGKNSGIEVHRPDKAATIKLAAAEKDLREIRDNVLGNIEQSGIPADICVQTGYARRKKLLICDMDSTLIGQECIDELADFAGVKDRVSAITERAMRGEIGFEGALTERVELLGGLPVTVLQKCFDERITLNPGARVLAETMKAHGAQTVIVSGGFTFFSERVAAAAGFEHHQANILLENGSVLSGKVQLPILGREAKRDALDAHSANIGGSDYAVAIGDGANDLAMVTAAGLGIAYKAKPAVAAAAQSAIQHTDLTSALYFQGYSDAEFVRN